MSERADQPGIVGGARSSTGALLGAGLTGRRRGRHRGRRWPCRRREPVRTVRCGRPTRRADRQRARSAVHGPHQTAILHRSQRQSTFLSCDVFAANKAELTDLLRTITDRVRFLTGGGTPAPVGHQRASRRLRRARAGRAGGRADGDTSGVGATLFDDRFGLATSKPAQLTAMRMFPNDDLDPAWCHGDLLLQIAAPNTDTVLHALRDIDQAHQGRHAGALADGRVRLSPPRPSGTPRNLMGFKDGTSNPRPRRRDRDEPAWSGPARASGEPAWTAGGSYLVVRLIRMLVEFWDRVSSPRAGEHVRPAAATPARRSTATPSSTCRLRSTTRPAARSR